MDHRSRSTQAALAAVLAALLTLAACSQDTAAPAPPVRSSAAPVTTAAPPTTAASTTTTEDPEVAAVRAAHLAYLAMFEVVGDPPDPDHPELALRATGDAYERLRANLAQDRLAGNRLVGGYESSIRHIEISGDSAFIEDCMLDTGVVYDTHGSVLVAADRARALRTSRLRWEHGTWKVWRLDVPSPPIPCDE